MLKASPFLFIAYFMMMQKSVTLMVGVRYRDMPRLIKERVLHRD